MDATRRWGFWRRHSRPRAKAVRIVEYQNHTQWSREYVVFCRFHVVDVVQECSWGRVQCGRHFLPANSPMVSPLSFFFSILRHHISCSTLQHCPLCIERSKGQISTGTEDNICLHRRVEMGWFWADTAPSSRPLAPHPLPSSDAAPPVSYT